MKFALNHRTAFSLAVGAMLSACGGGSTPPETPTPTTGYAVDGYLKDATVVCDANSNGVADSGESSVTTSSNGGYTFSAGCTSPLLLSGGTNVDTGLAFTGQLSAPSGSGVITPLTSLIASGMTQAQIIAALGLPAGSDILQTDPAYSPTGTLVNPELMRATSVVQLVLAKSLDIVAALAGSMSAADRQAAYSEGVKAVSAKLSAGGVLSNGTAIDQSVLSDVVASIATRVGQSSAISSGVRAALTAVNAESLGKVTASGLKTQLDAVLATGSSASANTAAVLAQSNETALATFIAANKSESGLTSAPSAATDSLIVRRTAVPGNTGNCANSTTATCISFDANTGLSATSAFGNLAASIDADPVSSANYVAKYVKTAGSEVWAGATLDAGLTVTNTVPPIDFAANKVVTLRVYSPAAGVPILVKFENAADAGVNVQKSVNTTKAKTWETLTFDFSEGVQGAIDSAKTYDRVSLFPNFLNTESADATYYFDELSYAKAQPVEVPSAPTPLTFSSGFTSAALTTDNGLVAMYGGSNLDNWACNWDPAWCGAGAGGAGATSYAYFYYQTTTPATGLYAGIDVYAPNVSALSTSADTAGVQVTNQTTLKFTLNQNPEWYDSATKNFAILLTVGKYYSLNGSACNPKLQAVVAPTASAATAYAVPLSSFIVTQNCGDANLNSVANVLAAGPVSIVSFQGTGGSAALQAVGGLTPGANLSVANANNLYPTTLALTGGIRIE